MARSDRMKKWMKVWVGLAGIMYFTQCALQAKPFLGVILGKKQHAEQVAAAPRR